MSERNSRAFCPVCGSTLGAIDDALVVVLAVGAFDRANPKALVPRSDFYRGSRPR